MEIPYFTQDGAHYRSKLFRWNGETTWVGTSKPQLPFGLQRLRLGGDSVVLTEGETCTMALSLAYPTLPVLGIPGASAWQEGWASYVGDFARVYLSFDGDRGGAELREAVKRDLPAYRAVLLPEGADTRDVLQRLGKRAYRVLVEVAERDYALREAWKRLDQGVRRRREVELAWERECAA